MALQAQFEATTGLKGFLQWEKSVSFYESLIGMMRSVLPIKQVITVLNMKQSADIDQFFKVILLTLIICICIGLLIRTSLINFSIRLH